MESKRVFNEQLQEEMQFAIHESGLKVYVFPKKGFSKYYAIYGTEYGSIDRCFQVPGEKEMTTVPDGIAHYLEHKLFEQEDGGNAFDLFAKTGASSNAFTSFDMTAYLFSCTDKFYENLDILLEFVNRPWFTQENVAKEQGIIGQEIKMYDDDAEWRVFFNALSAMYHENPVKIDIAGTVESISHITPDLLYRCYNTFYNPANMVLVLVGDVELEKAMTYVDKYVDASRNLGQIPRGEVSEPKERKQEMIEQKLLVSRPLFRIGFKETSTETDAVSRLRREIANELILEAVFGKSSDFYMELYEEGLIDSSFGAETEIAKTYGFTLLGGESNQPEKVYQKVKEKLETLQKGGIPAEELARARKVLISGNIRMFNSVERMGNAFIRHILAGYQPLEFADAVKQVNDEMVLKQLVAHFDTGNCVLS
ncbi:MAG: insulinase family protein, partial [Clostridia bacterium]|nr:insulinase family protein [Clostridia bacterium]